MIFTFGQSSRFEKRDRKRELRERESYEKKTDNFIMKKQEKMVHREKKSQKTEYIIE